MGLDPLIQAVLANTKSGRYVGHLVATLADLFDRFSLEFFGVSLLNSWHLLLGLRFEAQRCLENPGRFNCMPGGVAGARLTAIPYADHKAKLIAKLAS